MIRFLHTSDWQLGMTRHFLAGEAQGRFTQDRIDAVRTILRAAAERDAQFVVVAGDVFEDNQVTRQTVQRTCEALGDASVPVFLLPGNHDPLDAGSVYRSQVFRGSRPTNVIVLDDETPRSVPDTDGVEVLGAPWRGKHPGEDLVARALRNAEPPTLGTRRVVIGHGIVDTLDPDRDRVGAIVTADLESALRDGRAHYVALGDRHSATAVDDAGLIRYSGAPEPTDYVEVNPGLALCVTLGDGSADVEEIRVGRWRFEDVDAQLDDEKAVESLIARMRAFDDKARTIVRLALSGSLTVAGSARLEDSLEELRQTFASLTRWQRRETLVIRAEGDGPEQLGLGGYVAAAWERLSIDAVAGDETAKDALLLLHRLALEVKR